MKFDGNLGNRNDIGASFENPVKEGERIKDEMMPRTKRVGRKVSIKKLAQNYHQKSLYAICIINIKLFYEEAENIAMIILFFMKKVDVIKNFLR